MDLARGRRSLGGLASMDEILNIPFDHLWSISDNRTHQESRSFARPFASPFTRRQAPNIDYEALRALGGFQQGPAASVAGGEEETYQELVQYDEGRVRRGVKAEILQSIPQKLVNRNKGLQCHICMEGFDRTKAVRQLPCKHLFCEKCIFQWLVDHDTCPTCRWKFPEHQTELDI